MSLIDTWTDHRVARLEEIRASRAPSLPEALRTADNDRSLAGAEIERLEYERIRYSGRRFTQPEPRTFYHVHPLERF